MPRHTGPTLTRDHVYLPHDERRPSFDPRRVWVIDNYRVRRWYYKAAPEVGDRVSYMDGTHTFITRVTATNIYMASSEVMRRPYVCARVWECLQPRLSRLFRFGRGTVSPAPATRYVPNQVTLYV